MEINFQTIAPIRTILDEKFAELAIKYSPEVVLNAWNEVAKAGGDDPDSTCYWDPEVTRSEVLAFFDEYFDFVETMIQKRQERNACLLAESARRKLERNHL